MLKKEATRIRPNPKKMRGRNGMSDETGEIASALEAARPRSCQGSFLLDSA
jgi:hypothetical protein